MAQPITLPVEFLFEVQQVQWHVAVVRPVGWFAGITDAPIVEVVEPGEYAGARQTVRVESTPADIAGEIEQLSRIYPTRPEGLLGGPTRLSDEIERALGTRRLEAVLCSVERVGFDSFSDVFQRIPEPRSVDPWQIRDEFLQLPRSTRKLAAFLSKWGQWGREYDSLPAGGTARGRIGRLLNPPDENCGREALRVVFPESIWADQERLGAALLSGPDQWLSQASISPHFEYIGTPALIVRSGTCLAAIESTITFDFLRGFKFRACARRDCQRPFRIESKHKRKYCCQACGHLVSVRRGRRTTAKAKKSTRKEQ